MKKIYYVLTVMMLALALVACTAKEKPVDPEDQNPPIDVEDEGVDPNTDIKIVDDTRVEAYVAYSSENEAVAKFKSLYTAIEYVVNEEDYGAYVTKLNGDDKDVKLFVYNERYASDSDDMFYYYSKGNQLDTYTSWQGSYWQDLAKIGNAIAITVSPTTGADTYFNSYKLEGVSSTDDSANGTAYWNVTTAVEASATVNMVAYSGITKQDYNVKLSESKFYPSMNAEQDAVPQIGFVVADANNVSHMGLKMDPKTGNWFYYSGEAAWNTYDLQTDKDITLMTSTWNDEGYFVPDEDINLSLEILKLTDEEGGEYIVDRLTMDFVQSKRKVVRDYEYSNLTQAGTIRFSAALDLENNAQLTDYMNGAKFENVVVTKATAYAYEEMQDTANYGIIAELDAGTYDILNSNPESAARYQTIIYNPAITSHDFSTAGKDVYNFSYEIDVNNNAISDHITKVIDLIDALPALEEITLDDKEQIENARKEFNELSAFRNRFVTNEDKLKEAELKIVELTVSNEQLEVIEIAEALKEFSKYLTINAIKEDEEIINLAYAKYMNLTEAERNQVVNIIGSNKIEDLKEFLDEINSIENETLLKIVDLYLIIWQGEFSFDGNVQVLAEMSELVKSLDEEEFNLLPSRVQNFLNDESKLKAFQFEFDGYMTTYNFILDVMEKYDLTLDDLDVSNVDHDVIAEGLLEVVNLWQSDVISETWNFRNNYQGRFDFVVEGGFAKYFPVLSAILESSELYNFNSETGLIDFI